MFRVSRCLYPPRVLVARNYVAAPCSHRPNARSPRRLIVPLPCPLPSPLLCALCHQVRKRVTYLGWHRAVLESAEYAKKLLGMTPRVAVRLGGGKAAKTKHSLLAFLLQLESLKQAQKGSGSIDDDVERAMRCFVEWYNGADDDGNNGDDGNAVGNSLAIGSMCQLFTGAECRLVNDGDSTMCELLAMFAATDRPGLGGGSGGGGNDSLPRLIVLDGPAEGDIFVGELTHADRLAGQATVDGDSLRCCSLIHAAPGTANWRIVEDMTTAVGHPRTAGHPLWTLAEALAGCDYTKGKARATAAKVLGTIKRLLDECDDGEVPSPRWIFAALEVDDELQRVLAAAVRRRKGHDRPAPLQARRARARRGKPHRCGAQSSRMAGTVANLRVCVRAIRRSVCQPDRHYRATRPRPIPRRCQRFLDIAARDHGARRRRACAARGENKRGDRRRSDACAVPRARGSLLSVVASSGFR